MSNPTKVITMSRPALLAEIKCLFLEYLPKGLSITERKIRIDALNMACNDVLLMNPTRFICEE